MQSPGIMIIRKANKEDLKSIMTMYASCVNGMIKNGIDQWDNTYPNSKVISEDIEKRNYYIFWVSNFRLHRSLMETKQQFKHEEHSCKHPNWD